MNFFRSAFALPIILALLSAKAFATTVTVNDAPLSLDPAPIVQAGRVFVPLRGVFESLGASVVYDNRTIHATHRATTISLSIGSTVAVISGQEQIIDTPPFIVGESTYVPLRFIAQAFGDTVNYDDATSTVEIYRHAYRSVIAPPPPRPTVIVVAPPPLPVYTQPPCPVADYLWMPGYWAWQRVGYYWVPGRWAAPPAVNTVWTPGYWGWNQGSYRWNAGYWGARVGFYGGVHYGFGYSGSGFSGGVWSGNHFHYNRAFVNVAPTIVHRVYFNNHPVQSITNIHYTVNNANVYNRNIHNTVNNTVISHSFNHIQANRIQTNHFRENRYQANRYDPHFSKRISIQHYAPQRYTQTRMHRQPRRHMYAAQHAMYRPVHYRRHRNPR